MTKIEKLSAMFDIKRLAVIGVAAVLIAGLIGLGTASTTGAEDTAGSADALRVSPVRTDVTVKPGSTEIVEIQVSNLTEHTVHLNPVQNDFVAGDEQGTPSLILDANESAPTHSLKQFMSPIGQVTLDAKESKTIKVKITVPVGAQAGGYFGAVQFTPSVPGSGGQVNLSTHVASLILLTVPGDLVEKLSITDFEVKQEGKTPMFFTTGEDIELTARFENKGNVQAGPFGDIAILKNGEVVTRTSFNNEAPTDMILPDSARRWSVSTDDIGGFGKYEVLGTFSYGQNNQTIEASTTFWIIPRWLQYSALAVIVLIIALAVIVPIMVGRKRKRRRRF